MKFSMAPLHVSSEIVFDLLKTERKKGKRKVQICLNLSLLLNKWTWCLVRLKKNILSVFF